jgi:hypothetical protein
VVPIPIPKNAPLSQPRPINRRIHQQIIVDTEPVAVNQPIPRGWQRLGKGEDKLEYSLS